LKKRHYNIGFTFLSLTAFSVLFWWISFNPTKGFTISTPGMDKQDSVYTTTIEDVRIGEFFEEFTNKTSNLKESWPRFRGPNSDNIYKSEIRLTKNISANNSGILWTKELGEGHAGPAIYEGSVYLLDYDEQKKADMLRCISLQDGKELWRRWYNVNVKRNHGMSRTVPAVTEDYILTIGPKCHVMCVDRKTGAFLWGIDITKEYNSEIPFWYTGQCPLIDNDIAIIATGGKNLLIGVDCKTGEVLWSTPNKQNWKMSHSSVMPYQLGDDKMFVYSAVGGVVGIAADGANVGKILWQSDAWNHAVVAPAPVCMSNGKIFLTAGYGAGSMMLELSKNDDQYQVEVLDEYKPSQGLACEQQTPLYYEGHLIGIQPKDGGALRNQLICVNPKDCKEVIWSSGKEERFGLGPYFIANGILYLLKDDGTLYTFKADADQLIKLDEIKLFDGHDSWAPMALADGYLLLRDSKKIYCIKLSA
jgi:outer membrane protein assembly factor BamB